MICPTCKNTIQGDADFCKHCGSPSPFSAGVSYRPQTLLHQEVKDPDASSLTQRQLDGLEERVRAQLSKLGKESATLRRTLRVPMGVLAFCLVVAAAAGLWSAKRIDKIEGDVAALARSNATLTALERDLADAGRALKQTAQDIDALLPVEETVRVFEVCTVTFDMNLGDAYVESVPEARKIVQGEAVEPPLPNPPEGKQFVEWNTEADGTGTEYAPGEYIGYFGCDITLYAQWADLPEETPALPTDDPAPDEP